MLYARVHPSRSGVFSDGDGSGRGTRSSNGSRGEVSPKDETPAKSLPMGARAFVAGPWFRLECTNDFFRGLVSGLMVFAAVVCVAAVLGRGQPTALWRRYGVPSPEQGRAVLAEGTTLVLYVFSNTDPEYYQNLLFFVEHGMPGCDNCDYVIIINGDLDVPEIDLPSLPPNARYMVHGNECFDWGTFGWALTSGSLDIRSFKYFLFLNSSVRGPFIPPYLKGQVHFTELMTNKLVGDVKLVGPTINCEGTAEFTTGERRQNPHVQSYAVATDAEGMQLLIEAGHVFKCYEHFEDTIYYSELGSSAVILNAGYNLDSFMTTYQGVDWRDELNWGCNTAENPFNYAIEDPVGLAPMEIMFVKVKANFLQLGSRSAKAAVAYDRWYSREDGNGTVLANPVHSNLWEYRAPLILQMAAVGRECFDCPYYRNTNEDIASMSCWELWTHFVNFGQFEVRPVRFQCDRRLENKTVPYLPVDDGLGWHQVTATGCARAPPLAAEVIAEQQAGPLSTD